MFMQIVFEVSLCHKEGWLINLSMLVSSMWSNPESTPYLGEKSAFVDLWNKIFRSLAATVACDTEITFWSFAYLFVRCLGLKVLNRWSFTWNLSQVHPDSSLIDVNLVWGILDSFYTCFWMSIKLKILTVCQSLTFFHFPYKNKPRCGSRILATKAPDPKSKVWSKEAWRPKHIHQRRPPEFLVRHLHRIRSGPKKNLLFYALAEVNICGDKKLRISQGPAKTCNVFWASFQTHNSAWIFSSPKALPPGVLRIGLCGSGNK